MKIKSISIVVIVTAIDILSVLFIDNYVAAAFIIAAVMAAGAAAEYYIIVKPVFDLKRELEETRKENAQLESLRKDFVANVTHELKTPLTSISGFIETLQQGAAEDPEVRTKFLDIMAIEAARLKRLIEDTLILSDIESGRETAEERIEVKETLENIAEFIAPVASERNIRIITDVGNGLIVRGSADRFRQMIVNIVENAIKYSNEGGRVWIDGYLKNGRVVIQIRDEGIGISQEDVERLFERFYRVDKSRSRKVGGTGLGLSIVKHIAALFGAEIKVESELGKGTSFYIMF